MPTITIDPSACSYLALCSCGWRSSITPTRFSALAAGQRHMHHSHPGMCSRIDSAVAKAATRSGVNPRFTPV